MSLFYLGLFEGTHTYYWTSYQRCGAGAEKVFLMRWLLLVLYSCTVVNNTSIQWSTVWQIRIDLRSDADPDLYNKSRIRNRIWIRMEYFRIHDPDLYNNSYRSASLDLSWRIRLKYILLLRIRILQRLKNLKRNKRYFYSFQILVLNRMGGRLECTNSLRKKGGKV